MPDMTWLFNQINTLLRFEEASMQEMQEMAYIAIDPSQPGAACAVAADDPRWIKDTSKDIARWIRDGFQVERVTVGEARERLMRWVPKDKKPKAKQATLL